MYLKMRPGDPEPAQSESESRNLEDSILKPTPSAIIASYLSFNITVIAEFTTKLHEKRT